jgi:SAM-dependent methyltransferase
MNDERSYWDKKILEWESTIYASPAQTSRASLLERLAAPFRKTLARRLEAAQSLVKDHVEGKTLVDLGCGSGIFLRRLLQYHPKRLIGVDIAPAAIERAQAGVAEMGLDSSQLAFFCRDLRSERDLFASDDFRDADIVTGIGFLDYLNSAEFADLFQAIRGKRFLFARAAESVRSPRELLRQIYLRVAHCPGSFTHSKAETDEALRRAGFNDYWYYDRDELRFISNLPPAKEGT